MKIQQLERSFSYSGMVLPDPGKNLSVDQVKDVFASIYPELTTASIEGPEIRAGKMVYSLKKAIGTKG